MSTKAIILNKIKYIKEPFQALNVKGTIYTDNELNLPWAYKVPGLIFDDKTQKLKLDFSADSATIGNLHAGDDCTVKGKLTVENKTAYLVYGSIYNYNSDFYDDYCWVRASQVKIGGVIKATLTHMYQRFLSIFNRKELIAC